ncbi:MAG: DUF4386 domain-containing protein [Rhodoglobus sp.]
MHSLTRTARLTGAAHLGLAVTGLLGFLVIRPQLQNADDPTATVTNILENSALANLSVGIELLVVITQALAALGFYALFRGERPVAAYAVASFGMANAAAILASAAMLSTAVSVAATPALAPAGDTAGTVALLYTLSDALWAAGGVFFGLWLIPMGWFMISTKRMPRVLGIILIAGGIGYVLSTVLAAIIPSFPAAIADGLVLPATVGELWTVGYLLVRGIRPAPSSDSAAATAATSVRSAR